MIRNIVAHSAAWMLAFCAVLISPVILVFGVPLVIGLGTDLMQAGIGPAAALLVPLSAYLLLREQAVRSAT